MERAVTSRPDEDTARSGAVGAVVLAAGGSSRMGVNKVLLEFQGEPLVRRAARAALAAGLSPVVVVLGHQAALAAAALEGLPCRLAVNPDPTRGQGSSLALGLADLSDSGESVAAAVVLLADMPLVTASLISSLVERWRGGGAPLVLADYGGVVAPPALYSRALFGELDAAGDQPGKRVVARRRGEAALVPFPPEALADVDRPGDLERLADRARPGTLQGSAP
jgi:molybdenum cofactor cytidylyltransferase